MMKRVIWIIVIILIGGYFVNNYLENKAKKEAEKTETERIEKATNAAIAQLVERTKAVDNWEKDLSKGDPYRTEQILTVELEKLWLIDRPILFFGEVKDIATMDQNNYRIEIEQRSLLSNIEYMFGTGLRLALQCQKQRIDSFLKEHPNLFKDFGVNNRVAVVAYIDERETQMVPGSEGEKEEIKIGKGKCIDLLYTVNVQLTYKKPLKRDAAKDRRAP